MHWVPSMWTLTGALHKPPRQSLGKWSRACSSHACWAPGGACSSVFFRYICCNCYVGFYASNTMVFLFFFQSAYSYRYLSEIVKGLAKPHSRKQCAGVSSNCHQCVWQFWLLRSSVCFIFFGFTGHCSSVDRCRTAQLQQNQNMCFPPGNTQMKRFKSLPLSLFSSLPSFSFPSRLAHQLPLALSRSACYSCYSLQAHAVLQPAV